MGDGNAHGKGGKTPGAREFGWIRRLPSKRYQASYVGPDLRRHTAPTTFTAKRDAEAWLASERKHTEDPETWLAPKARVVAEYARREREKAMTFGVYAEDWLAHRNLAPATRHKYRRLLDRHLLQAFAERPLTTITRQDVAQWHRRTLVDRPTTRKHAYDLLAVIMRSAEDDELITKTPVRIAGASKVERAGETKPATMDELAVIVDRTPERYRLMVLLGAWCALRVGELRELRRGDIDVKRGVLHVRRSVGHVPGETVVKSPKTKAGVRTVAIPEHLLPLVAEHLLSHYTQPGSDGLLFPSARGKQLRDAAVAKWYFPAREAAGRTDLRFYDLRHTGATLAAQSGATIAELMHRLGHASPAAAMRYQHSAVERDREIARRMSETYVAQIGGGE